MSASDAAPLPRLGEVFFDVRGESRSMRLSWYADTGVAVFSIWQGGTCTGTFRLPVADLPRMVQILQRGPHGDAGQAGHADRTGQHSAAPGGQHGATPGGRHSGSHARPLSDEPTGVYRPEDDWTPPGYVPGSRAGHQEEPPPYQPGPPGYHPQPPARHQAGPRPDYQEGPAPGHDGPPPGYDSNPPAYDGPPPGFFQEPPGFGGGSGVPGYRDQGEFGPGEFGPGGFDESPVRPYVDPAREPPDERAGESFPYGPPAAQPPRRHRPRNPGGH